jgi:hypothetical protein
MRVAQTQDELREHLADQVSFIRSSEEAFDGGAIAEAKRLAHHLRVLLHDTATSHALLEQIGVLGSMVFFDSAGEVDPVTESNLTIMEVGHDGAQYRATLRDPPAMLDLPSLPEPWRSQKAAAFQRAKGRPKLEEGAWRPFDVWWRTEEVVKDDHGLTFSRRELVLAVANQDGGSHVDPTLREAYARLSRSNSLGWIFGANGIEDAQAPLGNPVPAAVRQIALEADVSLVREFPGLGTPIVPAAPWR